LLPGSEAGRSPTQSAEIDTGNRAAGVFGGLRPLLFSIAYRMLGSVASSEDMLQEAFIRFERASEAAEAGRGPRIESPKSYLSAIVTRLAIDELKSARARRETYSGIWLPEPVVTEPDSPLVRAQPDPQAHAEAAESLTMAFLLLLDRLNPVERAVFLLHDVFGYEYAEIAPIVDRSEVNCRQIAARARKRVRNDRPRLDADHNRRADTAQRFFEAMNAGDVGAIERLLAHDVVVYGDGGGKAPQWSTPIEGRERVARLIAGLGQQIGRYGVRIEPTTINGEPGAILRTESGEITNVLSIDIADGVVRTIRGVINPDKLRHLGPVADVRALARSGRPDRGS
jgi:RNA polymerase sigma-70 factor (ECF subfamily)